MLLFGDININNFFLIVGFYYYILKRVVGIRYMFIGKLLN